jgi:DNA-binding NtrC family response regulator
MVEEKLFREDLFYRINVIHIHLPPLRERGRDVLLLAQQFVERYAKLFDKPVTSMSPEAAEKLLSYSWPGNVRELQNAIERAVVLSMDDTLHLEHMFQHLQTRQIQGATQSGVDSQVFALPLTEAKQHFEKAYLENLLKVSGGNISEAARISGRYRADIYRLMNRYGFDQDQFR